MAKKMERHDLLAAARMETGMPRFLTPRFAKERFPWMQIGAYIGSLILTFIAFYMVQAHLMRPRLLITAILALALGQAGLQLGVFMHVRESRGPAWQIIPLGLGFAIGAGLIGMSIWIMAFKSGVS